MSDDIVAQLRTYFGSPLLPVSHQAADEIERLRAGITRLREALKHYACDCAEGKCESSDVDSFACGSKARAALAEKEPK